MVEEYEKYIQKAEATFDNLQLLMLRQFNKARNAAGHQEEAGEVCCADCSGCCDPVGSLIADRAELAEENRKLRTAPPDTTQLAREIAEKIVAKYYIVTDLANGVELGDDDYEIDEIASIIQQSLAEAGVNQDDQG